MRYTYHLYNGVARLEIGTRLDTVKLKEGEHLIIFSNESTKQYRVNNQDELDSFLTGATMYFQWRTATEEAKSLPKVPNTILEKANYIAAGAVADDTYPYPSNKLTLGQLNGKVSKDVINPDHYQGYVKDLQWLETMQYLPHFRDPKCFKAAVELQVRKYLDRMGQKDDSKQELKKALWYLKFLLAYELNGDKPIYVKDIPSILKEP